METVTLTFTVPTNVAATVLAMLQDTGETSSSTEKPVPVRARKAAPAEEPTVEYELDDTTTETEDEDGPTLSDVLKALQTFVEKKHKGDKKAAIAVMKKFGIKKPNELDEADYTRFIKALK